MRFLLLTLGILLVSFTCSCPEGSDKTLIIWVGTHKIKSVRTADDLFYIMDNMSTLGQYTGVCYTEDYIYKFSISKEYKDFIED